MKKYHYRDSYRGQQIEKNFWAKNDKEAAKKMKCSVYNIQKYCAKNSNGAYFDGVKALFDSGKLWTLRKDLIRVLMPLEDLEVIIDSILDKE